MPKNSILIDLDDPRTAEIAEAISNKTAKSILNLIAEQELTETEISEKLSLPLNTIDYNIKKLEKSGLIEKAKTFSWSSKGKAVYRYKTSNKRIIISPKSLVRGALPAFFITLLLALVFKGFLDYQQSQQFSSMQDTIQKIAVTAERIGGEAGSGAETFDKIASITTPTLSPLPTSTFQAILGQPWLWFLLGALVAIIIFVLWNKKTKRIKE